MSEGYNGWANYETWAVNLELCEDLCRAWEDEGQSFDDIGELREALQETVLALVDEELDASRLGDQSIMYHWALRSLANVNWWEIAKHYEDQFIGEAEAATIAEEA